jgi:hypothetical protein
VLCFLAATKTSFKSNEKVMNLVHHIEEQCSEHEGGSKKVGNYKVFYLVHHIEEQCSEHEGGSKKVGNESILPGASY